MQFVVVGPVVQKLCHDVKPPGKSPNKNTNKKHYQHKCENKTVKTEREYGTKQDGCTETLITPRPSHFIRKVWVQTCSSDRGPSDWSLICLRSLDICEDMISQSWSTKKNLVPKNHTRRSHNFMITPTPSTASDEQTTAARPPPTLLMHGSDH